MASAAANRRREGRVGRAGKAAAVGRRIGTGAQSAMGSAVFGPCVLQLSLLACEV